MSQYPSVGRFVHVIVDPATNNGQDFAPAVITRVFSDQCVNVRILLDSDAIERKTSVPLFASRDALEAADPRVAGEAFGAFWPPRV